MEVALKIVIHKKGSMAIYLTFFARHQCFLFLLSVINTTIFPTEAASFGRSGNRIVNGVNVTPYNKYPMMVALATNDGVLIGGGTIWSKYFILTSAEVAKKFDTQNARVLAGIYHFADPDRRYLQNISVERKLIHERHLAPNKGSWPNNIALLELTTALVWNDYVAPTNVPEPGWTVLPTIEVEAITVGWGRGKNGTFPYSPTRPLQEATASLLTTDGCQRVWKPVVDDNVCINPVPTGGGTCDYDQGNPLFIYNEANEKHTQVGIASQVASYCEEVGHIGGYFHTKVSKYLQWIDEAVRECS